jgi:hypothetical protein
MNPTVNKARLMCRIETKILLAARKMGFVTATGTQAVLRCAGVAMKINGRTIIETGECAIVAPLAESAILRWREYVN